jgi:hypothetical protein
MHVFSAGATGVSETYWGPGIPGKVTDQINNIQNAPGLTSFVTKDGIMHVFSAGATGVFETYWGPGIPGKVTDQINNVSRT